MKIPISRFLQDGASTNNVPLYDSSTDKFSPGNVNSLAEAVHPSSITCGQGAPFAGFSNVAAAVQTANLAFYMPFRVLVPITVKRIVVYNGGVVFGNFDVGVYNSSGTRQGSSGSTAQSGTSQAQVVDISDIGPLSTGVYYMAFVSDNGIGQYNEFQGTSRLFLGLKAESSAFPLPATATFSDPTDTLLNIPIMSLLMEA